MTEANPYNDDEDQGKSWTLWLRFAKSRPYFWI